MPKFICWPLLALFFMTAEAGAGSRLIDDFRTGLGPGWESKSFKGETRYFPAVADGVPCLRAEATASASGLFHKVEYNAAAEPILAWSWKVDNLIARGDARTKGGDDYPARIYVVFPSLLFWKTKALNYVWATNLPEGTAIPNSFTSNAMMVAVDSERELSAVMMATSGLMTSTLVMAPLAPTSSWTVATPKSVLGCF